MNFTTPRRWRAVVALLSAVVLTACDSNSKNAQPVVPPLTDSTYSADIVWTQYGVPHVTAADWGSLGYGAGYAVARENFCTLMRAYIEARGDSARYFGEDGNIDRDFLFKVLNDDAAVERMWKALPNYLQDNVTGYVAGVNRYLDETGVAALAEGSEGCRGAEWVRQVTVEDAVRLFHMLALYASSYELAPLVAAADPDTMVASRALPPQEELAHMLYAATDPEKVREALGLPSAEALGSNAYAVGADASQTNAGILLGNPHFPWQRNRRFFMFHLTMGDEYDVMGGALIGAPIPLIGFNRNLAWSHTVSTAQRFTFYELTLNPDNKMQYLYDGEYRDITSRTVTVGRKAADGSVESVEHTLYFSHYGPIADLGAINSLGAGWPNAFGSLVSYRDANLENMRLLEEFLQMGQARDLGEFKQALRAMGLPWVNTIAADRYGDAFYGDVSTTPNTSIAKIRNCVRGVAQNFLTDSGVLTMDGSDSSCEWGNDPDTAPGVLGYDNMPKLDTRQYAANANDSYWLPNPRHLITGYPKVIGREEVEQSLRTRHTFDQAEMRLAGSDGLGAPGFNVDNIRQLHYQAANYAAGLVLDDVLGICRAQEDDPLAGISQVQEACTVLSAWDRSHRIDSVGAHIFTEFWRVMRETPDMFATPFDPADPVHTPRALKVDDPAVVAAVQDALLQAVERLAAAGIPLDRPWGEVQFVEKNGVRYGIHGGSGGMMFNVITSDLVDGEGYSNITHGNSYMQAVTWDESDCPDAYVMLTYSQSTDPASAHYADATALYSSSGWIDVPFCRAEQDAQELGRETISE